MPQRCNLIKLQCKLPNESIQIARQITKVTSFEEKQIITLAIILIYAQTPLQTNKSLCFPRRFAADKHTLEYTHTQ